MHISIYAYLLVSFLLFVVTFLIVSRSKMLVRDIIRREQQEDALRESQNFLYEIQRLSHSCGWRYDFKKKEIIWSDELYRLLGYEPGLVVPTFDLYSSHIHPDDRAMVSGIHESMEQVTKKIESRIIDAHGSIHHVLMRNRFEFSKSGQPANLYVAIADISELRKVDESLQTLVTHQQVLLAAIPDILVEVDTNKIYTWANQPGFEFFGPDVIGREAAYYFEGDQDTYQHVNEIFKGSEKQVYIESWQCRWDGEKRLLAWWCHVLKDAAGNVTGALSTARDITERRQVEKALQLSEYRQKSILNNIPDLAWIKDGDGKYIAVNESFAKTAGRAAEEIPGKTDQEVWDSESAAKFQAVDLQVLKIGERTTIQESLPASDGTTVLFESIKTPLYNDEGTLLGTVGIARDITERNKMVEEIRLAAEKWRTTFDTMLDPVSLLDVDGTVKQCNQAFVDFLGLDFPDVLGRKCYELIHKTDDFIPGCPTVAAVSSGVREIMELEVGSRILLVVVDPIKSDDGTVTGFVHIMRDITERKQIEEEIRAKNIELEHFTYTISHDLKSPLITIRTFAGALIEDMASGKEEKIAQDLAYINSASEKMNTMIDELLQLSRIGCMLNALVETPLKKMVQETLDLVSGRIAKCGCRVQVAEEPVLLYGERVRLAEVFQNLIDNAIKFMGDQSDPLVEIGFERKNGEIAVFVRDNGIGIDPRHQDNIFGLFEKMDPDAEGSGMGLAIVKRIVDVHGGRVWVQSEGLGQGACFWFVLPGKSEQ